MFQFSSSHPLDSPFSIRYQSDASSFVLVTIFIKKEEEARDTIYKKKSYTRQTAQEKKEVSVGVLFLLLFSIIRKENIHEISTKEYYLK